MDDEELTEGPGALAAATEAKSAKEIASQEWVDAFNARVQEMDRRTLQFALTATRKLTVDTVKGYKKVPYLGGVKFELEDCYVGKRGTIVFRFQQVSGDRPTGAVTFMEMGISQAIGDLEGFKEWFEVRFQSPASIHKEIDARAKAITAESFEKTINEDYADNEVFGSW